MKRLIPLVLFAAALGAWFATAPRPAGAQLPPRNQTDPDITYLGARDEYLLVWAEDVGAGAAGATHRLMAKRVRTNGLPVGGAAGGAWALTGATSPSGYPGPDRGDQRWPAVIDGLVVWSELRPGGTDYDLYAQRLFDNARSYGRPTLIAGGPGNQSHADVAYGPANDWLVVWSEDTTDAGDVMGIRISPAVSPRGPAFPIAQGPGTAEDPSISRDPGGTDYFLILFTDNRAGNKDIYGTRVTEAGLPRGGSRGGQFPVVDTPQDDYAPALVISSASASRGPQRGPGSPIDPRDLVLWTTDDVLTGANVMGQRLRTNGLPVGASFLVAGGAGNQGWPGAALRTQTTERPEWLAVWSDDALGSEDIMGVEIGLNGIIRRNPRPLATD